ncbi:hypothetical protein FQA39_LY12597 [Lamprigera yunnana]|nr:hypothetical protein FQA39_LY12597 [Lamprigera yunnana]
MATFRVYDDQENRGISDLRHKNAEMASLVNKRSVLGPLQNKTIVPNQNKGKQPLGISNANKVDTQRPPPPIVPVAQFEAFKVYEDLKENHVQNVEKKNRPDAEQDEASSSKREWYAQESKPNLDRDVKPSQPVDKEVAANISNSDENNENLAPEVNKKNESSDLSSPMSIEKSVMRLDLKPILIRGGKLSRDKFFEIEEYRTEIYLYLRELELHNRPKPGYMRKQPDINYSMRTILVDWLVEVALEYKLQSETLFLAVNYIDRFLSYMSVVRGKLQLVGTAAMFIAAKYEEIYPPDISEFVYITDDTYTRRQVVRMEHLILKVLSFDLSVPTPLTFITAMSIATGIPDRVMYLAMYLTELAMLETDAYLETLPSVLAAAAIAVARYTLNLTPWTKELKCKTGYETQDFKRTMEFLYILFCKAGTQNQRAIQEKYSSSKYLHVSKLTPRSEDIKLE